MTYNSQGKRITSENLAGQVTTTAWDQFACTPVGELIPAAKNAKSAKIAYAFDDDGNQTLVKTATGIWHVQYNGEGRPVNWSSGSTNITMKFDRLGRRVEYVEKVGVATNNHQCFVYDGHLCVRRIDASDGNAAEFFFGWDPTEPVVEIR